MRTATAHERHCAHHIRATALAVVAIVVFASACGNALPRPPIAPVAVSDYVPVPFPPRAPPVEFIPPSPAKNAVWVDGSWEWAGDRYGWKAGTWVVPPAGVRYAPWMIVRRKEDGQLFFAPSSWKDASGELVDDRAWSHALGVRARARSRAGVSPTEQSSAPEAPTQPVPLGPERKRGESGPGGQGDESGEVDEGNDE